jgi:PAS domain S-box-containing protein
MEWRPRLTLRVRVLALALLAVIPALVLSAYAAWADRQYRLAVAGNDALAWAKNIAVHHADVLDDTRRLLTALAEAPDLRGGNLQESERVLAEVVKQYPRYAGLVLVRPDGTLLCSAPPGPSIVSFADRSWFQRVLRTRSFSVGELQIGRITGRPVLVVGLPILNPESQVNEVLGAALDLAWINRRVTELNLPAGFVCMWVDSQGTVLARHPESGQAVGQTLAEPFVPASITNQPQGITVARGSDSRNWIYAVTSVRDWQDSGLRLAIAIPEEIALEAANRIHGANLIALSAIGLLTLLLAWFGADLFILRPVRTLLSAIKRVEAGDLGTRTGLRYDKGELGDLAQAFDTMAQTLGCRQAEQAAVQAALVQSEERHRRLAETAEDSIFIIDRDFRVEYVNPHAAKLVRMAPEQVVGKRVAELLPAVLAERSASTLRQIFRGETSSVYSELSTAQVLPGQELWLGTRLVPIRDTDGAVQSVLGIARDVTEQRALEAELRQAHKMEAIGRLAGGVAHDFNNLLTAILGYSGLVLGQLDDTSPLKPDIAEIQKAGQSGASLTRQLLAFSRKQVLEPRVLDVGTVVTSCEGMLRRVIGEDIDTASDAPPLNLKATA